MWQLEGNAAHWRCDQMQLNVRLDAPHRGLLGVQLDLEGRWRPLPESLRLLRLEHLDFPGDAYVRGPDLVANFRPADQPDCSVQVYWRVQAQRSSAPQTPAGLEMILSTQTSRWDSNPQVQLTSELPAAATRPCDDWGLRCHTGWTVDCLQLAHPSNHGSISVRDVQGTCVWRCRVFPERLERGVIRRNRFRILFLDATDPPATVQQLYQQFSDSSPPLTT